MDHVVTIIGWMFGLIFVYLLFSNGQTANNLFSNTAFFVQNETRTLQGR